MATLNGFTHLNYAITTIGFHPVTLTRKRQLGHVSRFLYLCSTNSSRISQNPQSIFIHHLLFSCTFDIDEIVQSIYTLSSVAPKALLFIFSLFKFLLYFLNLKKLEKYNRAFRASSELVIWFCSSDCSSSSVFILIPV